MLYSETRLLFDPNQTTLTLIDKICLTIQGPDARNFLQKQLTQDLSKLTPENPIPVTAACTRQGRVIATFSVFQTTEPDCFGLVLPILLLESSLKYLKYYSQFNQLTIQTQNWTVLGICAPISQNIQNIIGLLDSQISCIIYPTISAPKNKILTEYILNTPKFLVDHEKKNYTFISTRAWRVNFILNRYLELTPATSNQYLPQTLNLINHQAIDFQKGCYLGQEVVSRVNYRGRVKKILTLDHSPIQPDSSPDCLDWSFDPNTQNFVFLKF